jgi:hypothetical protein
LDNNPKKIIFDNYNKKLSRQIQNWLGDKSPDKIRIVRLLSARLTWDWKSYEELQHGGEYKDIELQACRMDICHYAFPKNLDLLLQGIGQMKPVKEFEGCGSYDNNTKAYIEKEFSILNDMLKTFIGTGKSDKIKLIRIWLIACLAKTIKEDVNLSNPIIDLVNRI